MIARHAAFWVVLAVAGLDAQTRPQRLAQGEPQEICGSVTSFTSGLPAHCDASLEVKTADGQTTVVVIPASARRGSSGGRELLDAEACFAGELEVAEAVTRIRVPSLASIRVTRPAVTVPFGAGVIDACAVGGLTSPRIVREVKPQYTSDAMRARVQGAVVMDAIVSAQGNVTNVRVTRSLDAQLDQQAVTALREWKFAPGTLDGKPVPVIVSVEMTFTLRTRR